ncbi:MAG: hypothetical protein RIF39_04115 [Cyclobacteriaceae bacterium]
MTSFIARAISPILMLLLTFCSNLGQNKSDLFEKAENRGRVSGDLEEASGLVASYKNPGKLWTLNDSGNPSELFLLNDKGEIEMTCKLKVHNRDWEDIAIGPGLYDSIKYLYIGEIGDNEAKYDYKYLYRVVEPTFQGDKKISIDKFDTLVISLPDGKRDMESITIDQQTGDLYLFSKREENINIYRSLANALIAGDTLVPEKIGTLPYHNVVAVDFTLDSKELLIKTYDEIYYWNRPDSLSIQQVLLQDPILLNYKREPQGESVAWSLDGGGFYTLSETTKDTSGKLYFYKRAK